MIPWKQYLTTVVETFRSHYDKITNEEKAVAQLNMTFAKPCQIEFFSFKDDGQIMLVTLLPNLSDAIIVHENLGKDFDFSSVLDKRLPELNIKRILKRHIKDGKVRLGLLWSSLIENASIYFFKIFKRLILTLESMENAALKKYMNWLRTFLDGVYVRPRSEVSKKRLNGLRQKAKRSEMEA
jgi:hypothetical protein